MLYFFIHCIIFFTSCWSHNIKTEIRINIKKCHTCRYFHLKESCANLCFSLHITYYILHYSIFLFYSISKFLYKNFCTKVIVLGYCSFQCQCVGELLFRFLLLSIRLLVVARKKSHYGPTESNSNNSVLQ